MATKKKPVATTRKVGNKPAASRRVTETAQPPSAGEEPRLFTDEEMNRAMVGWREHEDKRKAAVRSTDFHTLAGATLEWLLADISLGSAEFRGRFEHGLSGISDDELAKLRALLRSISEAAHGNDAEALRQAAGFFDQYMAIDTKQSKLIRALELVEFASRRVKEDQALPTKLVFHLTALDSRFGKPRNTTVASAESQGAVFEHVRAVLSSVRHGDARAKGGARNIGAATALARLLAFTGALDASTDAASEKKKIENALAEKSKLRKPKKAQKRV